MKIPKIVKKLGGRFLVKEEVSEDVFDFRKTICSTCQNNKNGECLICGCLLETKWKSKINYSLILKEDEVTHCPKGYWLDKDLANYYNKLKNHKIN